MSKNKRKYLIIFGVSILFLFFYYNSTYYLDYIKENLSETSARYEKATVSPKVMEKALENIKSNTSEYPQITLWNRLMNESIESKLVESKVETNVIEAYGDMSLILPMTYIQGNYVYPGDFKGCVLDAKTAYNLFGTVNALNNRVIWKGKEYVVRGVVRAKDTMMLIQISDKDYLFSNMEALYQKRGNSHIIDNQEQSLKDLLTLNGAKEPDAVIDGGILCWKLGIISKLPMWILVIIIIVLLIKMTVQNRRSPLRCIIYVVATIIISLILMKITHFSIHIPSQFIPTKWSDFDFYVDKYKQIQESRGQIKNCTPMPKDLLRKSVSFYCMLYSVFDLFIVLFMLVLVFSKIVKNEKLSSPMNR
jgi:hypothetical protein